jgi:hypothetical protein
MGGLEELFARLSEILTKAQACGSKQDVSPLGFSDFLSGVAATPPHPYPMGLYMDTEQEGIRPRAQHKSMPQSGLQFLLHIMEHALQTSLIQRTRLVSPKNLPLDSDSPWTAALPRI